MRFFKNGYQEIYEHSMMLLSENNIDISKARTSNGTAPFKPMKQKDIRKKIIDNLNKQNIDSLIVIGGNGSLIGDKLIKDESNINVSVIPGIIDNDFPSTDYTLCFDTSLNKIIATIDEFTTTANSHERVLILEVMGRSCSSLVKKSALASFTSWVNSSPESYLLKIYCTYKSQFYSPILLIPEGLVEKDQITSFWKITYQWT